MPGHYRLLVFDWDGTLMDSAAQIVDCMQGAVRACGLPAPAAEAVHDVIGLSLDEAVGTLLPCAEAPVRGAVVAHYRAAYARAGGSSSPLFPGVQEALELLHDQGYLLAVATGKGREGLRRALRESALEGLFHATRSADEAWSKPHPQMLLDLLDQLAVEAGEALMIGDSTLDLEMARNAGIPSVGVCCGVHRAERLLEFGPQACLDGVHALPGWLRAEQWG